VTSGSIDFLELFVGSPGELLYFFSVIAISLASLLMVVGQRLNRPTDYALAQYTNALLAVVVSWIILMGGSLIALATDTPAVSVLPPLERAVSTFTILVLLWAFVVSDHPDWSRAGNGLVVIGGGIILAAYIFSAAQWRDVAGRIDFNLGVLGATWTFATAMLSLFGIVVLLANFNRIVDAPLKLVFFLLLLAGHGWTLVQILQGNIIGDYAGPIRLSILAALVIIPAVVYRVIIRQLVTELETRQAPVVPLPSPVARPAISPVERESVQLLRALGMILDDATASNVPDRIISAVSELIHADIVAILRLQDANYADISLAVDNIMKRQIDGIAINLDNQPTLVNSIERRAQRILTVDRNEDELHDLFTRLDVQQVGPVYFQPLTRDRELVAVLMVAMPYTTRELAPAEAELLKGVSVIASNLLALSYAAREAESLAEERAIQAVVQGAVPGSTDTANLISTRQETQNQLKLARDQIASLSQQVLNLKIELDDERTRLADSLGDTKEGMSISQQLWVIREEQINLRAERDKLRERLQEAEAAIHGALATDSDSLLQDLVESLRQDRDELEHERDQLLQQINALRDRTIDPAEAQPVVDSMAGESARIAEERDRFKARLVEIEEQLKALGVSEGTSGLTQIINQLSEQRAYLQSQLEAVTAERDRLLKETSLDTSDDEAVTTRIRALETEIQNLAGDREAITKQRDRLKSDVQELQDKLNLIKQHRTRLLAQASAFEMELQESQEDRVKLRQQVQALAKERSELIQQRDQLIAEERAARTERDQLLARIEGDRGLIEEIGTNGVGSLTAMIEELTAERNALENQLAETQSRLEQVERQATVLRLRDSLEGESSARFQPDNPDLLIGLVEELRTPMTSIIGYVDLLLGESAGILGEMQRKFLQRVSTNVSRLSTMLDDLVHVTELDTGKFSLEPVQVNVLNIIEDSITNASTQFREKGLVVNLDLDEELPTVQGDPDSLGQVIGQLLTNAYLVSPPSTEVSVSARSDTLQLNGTSRSGILVTIEDRGGGISPEDEPRVFARKYKAENPLIRGLGDTGVGLSVAKALVEAHGGKLWLETKENVGSSFSFFLPVDDIE